MIINTNIAAVNAFGHLRSHENDQKSALEKLSSGFNINKAADDVAGLGISEKMRGQIRGLSQAGRNIQDGMSLVQVAEGGLEAIHAQLQRARELCVQAANGICSAEDRQHIQKEIDQIVAGIDSVAHNTEFNTIPVLAPPAVGATQSVAAGKADIVFVVDNTTSMSGLQTQLASNLSQFASSLGIADVRFGMISYDDDNVAPRTRTYDFSMSQWDTTSPASEWTQDPTLVSNALTNLTNSGGTENAMAAIETAITQFSFRPNDPGMQSRHIVLLTNEDADDAVGNAPPAALMAQLTSGGFAVHTVFNPSWFAGDDSTDILALSSGTGGISLNLNDSWGSQLSSILGPSIGQAAGGTNQDEEMPTLLLQVGANCGQTFSIELFDARAKKLGIDPLNVDPQDEAVLAIDKVAAAITIISAQRGKFGAYHNALEHIAANVANSDENIVSAESRIRDADIAKEMMTFKKMDILSQSSQAVLAQANQQLQGVLNLLE